MVEKLSKKLKDCSLALKSIKIDLCDRIGIKFGARYEDLVRELEDPDDLVKESQLMMRKDDPDRDLMD